MREIGQFTSTYDSPQKVVELNLIGSNIESDTKAPPSKKERKSVTIQQNDAIEEVPKNEGMTKVTLVQDGENFHLDGGRLILPCIAHKDFNHIPYLLLLIMNRFWDNLFKRTFLNERMRVRNMLALQEAMFIHMSDSLLPIAIRILEDKEMEALGKEDLIPTECFNPGNEYDLVTLLLRRK